MAHVKFIVLPAPTYRSGPPSIVAVGTAMKKEHHSHSLSLSLSHPESIVFFFPPTCARVKRREGEILFEKRETLERRTRERFTDLAPTNETKTFHSRAKVIAIEITRPSFVSRSPKLGSRISLSPSFSFSFFRRTRSIERSEV